MIPTVTTVRMTLSRHRADLPLLVLGPALGTSATALWTDSAAELTDAVDVLAWDLPGHGYNRPAPGEGFTMAELAAGVLRIVDDVVADRGQPRGPFVYAGVSVGGAVGLQLLLDAPDRVASAVLVCTGARLGTRESWAERVAQVRADGTAGQVSAAAERWFAAGFADREPGRAAGLVRALEGTLDAGYVQVCEALAGFDVRDRLGEVGAPVLAVAGADDVVTTPSLLRELADGVRRGTYAEVAGAGHLAPAERPAEVAALLRRHVLGEEPADPGEEPAATEDVALEDRARSIVALAVLVASGDDGLAPAVRAAVDRGLHPAEVEAVLREAAAVSGRSADAALAVAGPVLGRR